MGKKFYIFTFLFVLTSSALGLVSGQKVGKNATEDLTSDDGTCIRVTNNCSTDVFVPFKSTSEVAQNMGKTPSCVTEDVCVTVCVPTPTSATPDGIDNDCDGTIDEEAGYGTLHYINHNLTSSMSPGAAYNCPDPSTIVPSDKVFFNIRVTFFTNGHLDRYTNGTCSSSYHRTGIERTLSSQNGTVPNSGNSNHSPSIPYSLGDSMSCQAVGSYWVTTNSVKSSWDWARCRYNIKNKGYD